MEHPFFILQPRGGRCCQLCNFRIFAFARLQFFSYTHKHIHTYAQKHIAHIQWQSHLQWWQQAMTSDTCVSASAQISHHPGPAQLKWSCAVEVWCDYSTDLFSHFKTVLFQTFLSLHTKICWFFLRGRSIITTDIVNSGSNSNTHECRSFSNRAMLAYLWSWRAINLQVITL